LSERGKKKLVRGKATRAVSPRTMPEYGGLRRKELA